VQELLEEKAEQLVNKLVELALAGNIGALRLCLDWLVRARANDPRLCEMPRLEKAADGVGAIAGLACAAAAGDVTPDEAAKLAKVITLYINGLETQDFEERLAKLERFDLERLEDVRNGAPINNDTG
jgi:hypothetical protein